MGPTASGKSALALALAERFAVEIVSVDSAQVYRGMDIGTAKPDAADACARAAPPDRHPRADRGVFGRTLPRRRARRDRRHPRARRRAAGRRRHDALLQGTARRPVRAAAPPIRRARAASTRAPRSRAGRRCTRSSRASIPRPRRASTPTDAQRIQRALEVLRAHGHPAVAAAGGARSRATLGRDDRDRARARAIARGCTRRSPHASTRCSAAGSSTSLRRCARASR